MLYIKFLDYYFYNLSKAKLMYFYNYFNTFTYLKKILEQINCIVFNKTNNID